MMNKSVSACALTSVTGAGEEAGWMVVVVGGGEVWSWEESRTCGTWFDHRTTAERCRGGGGGSVLICSVWASRGSGWVTDYADKQRKVMTTAAVRRDISISLLCVGHHFRDIFCSTRFAQPLFLRMIMS